MYNKMLYQFYFDPETTVSHVLLCNTIVKSPDVIKKLVLDLFSPHLWQVSAHKRSTWPTPMAKFHLKLVT